MYLIYLFLFTDFLSNQPDMSGALKYVVKDPCGNSQVIDLPTRNYIIVNGGRGKP